MNKFKVYIIIFLVSFIVFGKEYHVDGRNEKKGDGSKSNPFQTIDQAAQVMKAGDVCYIHACTYRELINPKNSGTAKKPIAFTQFENDMVIISSTDPVDNWAAYKSGVYKALNVQMDLGDANNVYLNQQKMQIARWPNDVDNNEYTLDAKYIDLEKDKWSMSFITNAEIPTCDWTGGIIHYLGSHSGCSWERTITHHDSELGRIYFETLPKKWPFGNTHSPQRFENGHRGIFYLMNKLEALDTANEWYYDQSNETLYFYPPDGVEVTEQVIEIATRSQTVLITQDYIHLNGLNFFGGMVTVKGNNNKITNCMVKHGAERLITNLDGAFLPDASIQVLEGENHVIEKCVLENGTLNGIFLSNNTSGVRVENCIVQYFNTSGLHTHLINSAGKGNKILKNSFYGSARDGVKVTGDDSEFGYNHVQKALISGADGGLFYVTGRSIPRNIELHHNWFHDAYGAPHAGKKATGIYLDNNAAGYIVHHNVVWNVEWGGLHFNWNALQNEIYNNTFWNVGPPEQAMIDSWVPVRNGDSTNVRDNILYNNISDVRPWWHSGDGKRFSVNESEYLGRKADNIFQDNWQFTEVPFSENSPNLFVPKLGSSLIDGGRIIEGITDDFNGAKPDLGAYEMGAEYWIPGVDWEPKGFAWEVGKDYLKVETNFPKP
ncbi:MAG: right-handed parallel beta-helix repeat-containing protein [Bacteroidota bacterium]